MKRVNFDPVKLGKIEVGWWKAHNEKNKDKLLQLLTKQNQFLYGLSKNESEEALKFLAAAVKYHDTRNWDSATKEAQKYYAIIKKSTGLNFDPEKAGKKEVGWWKLHDELEFNPDKSLLEEQFTSLYSEIFRVDKKELLEAGKLRAKATQEHDLAEDPATPKDEVSGHWQNTENLLIGFYKELKAAFLKDPSFSKLS